MTRTFVRKFHRTFNALAAAARAANAVDNGHRPRAEDLTTLGINPADFPRTSL